MESNKIKILAIDDNLDNLITIQALVYESFQNAIVIKALSGKEGLQLAAKENPDVILLDIVMPDMDGFEVCKLLKIDKKLSDIPVVFVTALKGDKDSRIKGLEVGGEAFLAKPIDESELVAQIKAMVKIKIANIHKKDENLRLAALVEERTQELKKTHTATLNLLEDLKNENEARKNTEEALRQSEELYRSVLLASPDSIVVTDLRGNILMASPVCLNLMLFVKEEEYLGHNLIEFVMPEDRERVSENIMVLMKGLYNGALEYKLIKSDNTIVDTEIKAEIVRNAEGQNNSIVFAIRDITERKRAQEELRESEEKFREMANLLPQIVFEIDTLGNITYLNKLAYKICGYEEKDEKMLIGSNALKFFRVSDYKNASEIIRNRIKGGTVESNIYTLIRKDGTTFPALLYSNPIYKLNKPVGLRGIIVDITEQKQIEKKLNYVSRLYAFLSQINQEIIRTKNADELFEIICKLAIQYGQFRMCWVGIYNEQTGKLEPIASAGYDEGYLEKLNIYPGKDVSGNGLVGKSFKEEKMIFCNDVATDPLMAFWKDDAIKRGYRSSFSAPIFRKGKPYGTFTLYASEINFFDEEEQKLLLEIREDFSYALDVIDAEQERKQAEQALEKSRNELKTIYDHAPVMMCVVDERKRIQFANKAFSALTGVSESELIGGVVGGVVGCIHSFEDARGCGFGEKCHNCSLRLAMENTFKTGTGYQNIEYQATLTLNDTEREVSLLGSTAIIDYGKNKSLLLCLHDITDRKQAEDALQKSEMLLRTFIENIPFEIWARDINNIGILENKKLVDHYGTIIGNASKPDPTVDKAFPKLWENNIKRVFEGEMIDEEYVYLFNNEERISQQIIFPIYINLKLIGIAGFNIDITDRKRIEKELIDQKRFFEQMFMQSTLSTQILDSDGWCERINPKLSQIFGVEAKNMEGHTYNIFNDMEIRQKGIIPQLEKVFTKGKTVEWEVFFDVGVAADSQNVDIKENKNVWFSNWAYPILDRDGKISNVIIQHTDITDRKLAQEALTESQEQLKKFAAHLQNIREEERVLLAREIHDELGQILIAIKIDMGMLKQSLLKVIDEKHSVEVLSKFEGLSNLVDNTIHTARKIMTDLRPEVLDLLGFTEAVNQHLKSFQERYKIKCIFDNSGKEYEFNTQQSVALFRIIQEALNNVAKHSKATEVKITVTQKAENLTLMIMDNGIGFDEKHKKNPDSYGLIGMNERVFLLDGELLISSKLNNGTTIKITMPYK